LHQAPVGMAMRILFVDDAPDTGFLFAMAFKIEGHSTRLATNGTEAVQAVEQEMFDAIVMDIEMPGMNGWDATCQIRRLPNGLRVPIVMFTGYTGGREHQRAIEAGANDLLHKPMLPDMLLSRISLLVAN